MKSILSGLLLVWFLSARCLPAEEFILLKEGAVPAIRGKVTGTLPIKTYDGRTAALFQDGAWVVIPTAKYFHPRQGGIDLWLRPGWAPTCADRHTFFHIGENDARSHFTVFKTERPTLRFVVKHDPQTYASVDCRIDHWKLAEWHRVRVSWFSSGPLFTVAMQLDEEPVEYRISGKPLEPVPSRAYIGRRGPAKQFAEAAVAQLRLSSAPILALPWPTGPLEPVIASVDASRGEKPFRRIYDCTTLWNNQKKPLPFPVGGPKWRRFKEARFRLARLVAFSESWLWGTRLERSPAGQLQLDFTDFDRLIDLVRSAGAEPYVRLAYHLPKILSSKPASPSWGYVPPANPQEWDSLIRRIVHHLNIERKLGVKYFVCTLNEADIHVAKYGIDWNEILELHERTARVALAVDPTIEIGGPAICMPLDGVGGRCLRDFVRFSKERSLPVDFISFHKYRASHPREFAEHLQAIKRIVKEANPELEPLWVCDEFNQWARDHRADDEYGAAYLAASIHYLTRAGLDKLSIVSFNDVLPPPSPPHLVTSFDGPFAKTRKTVARFLARELSAVEKRKRAILAHPPRWGADYTFGRFQVHVPQQGKPRLMFFTGIAASHPKMDGVGFSVAVTETDTGMPDAAPIFKHTQRRQDWTAYTVSLEKFRGKNIWVEFRTDRGPAPHATGIADHAAWGEPRLVTGPAGTPQTFFDFVKQIDRAKTGTVSNGWKFQYNNETIAKSFGLPLIKGPVVTAPYFVLLMLNQLVGRELPISMDGEGGIHQDGSLGILATADGEAVQLLVWQFNPLVDGNREVRLSINNLGRVVGAEPRVRLQRWLIDATHTNPWYEYAVKKTPPGDSYNLKSGNLEKIEDQEVPLQNGQVLLDFKLPAKSVTLFTLTRVRH